MRGQIKKKTCRGQMCTMGRRTKQEKGRFVNGSEKQNRQIAYVLKGQEKRGHMFTRGKRTKQVKSRCVQREGIHNR